MDIDELGMHNYVHEEDEAVSSVGRSVEWVVQKNERRISLGWMWMLLMILV
jgi:hypothetical protein